MSNIHADYIWVDTKLNTRFKRQIIRYPAEYIPKLSDFPEWNFDGSSTGQNVGTNTEVILKPKCFIKYLDKKFDKTIYLVLCDCYDSNDQPIESNTRYLAEHVFNKCLHKDIWFGIEQEYVFIDPKTQRVLGWPTDEVQNTGRNDVYCGVGVSTFDDDMKTGREIAEEHLYACEESGIRIFGINREVLLGQWEFQIDICTGIEASDQLTLARHLLVRISERHNIQVSFNPKPVIGNWNGSGCHVNFSTKESRMPKTGYDMILSYMEKLKAKHSEHLKVCGTNTLRLTGKHETSSLTEFTYGVGDRSASVRIPTKTFKMRSGYIEDRRPASDCDPYLVTSMIAKTIFML